MCVRTVVLGLAVMALASGQSKEGIEFFEAKIRPVLAKNCYGCHSAATKQSMGGLRLDTRDAMQSGGQSGAGVVPGSPAESLVIKAIRHEGRKMPPGGKLPEAVVADFEKWVAMGAPDPREGAAWKAPASQIDLAKGREYWAFQPPVKPALPKVTGSWARTPIDRFVLAGLQKARLTPVADADKATLLRRITFDLTGLPPTPAELDAFLADRSPKAFEKVVDKMLASSHFGERWGRHWLDVARYADSMGRTRNYPFPYAWRYRDYVIRSFNQDKPYDQFLREQIAGDLLPAKGDEVRREQLVATGFLALGAHDLNEQDAAQYQMDVVDDQINATTRSVLALTVGCARCHDHKFDPIPTTDYYALAGIFRSTEMKGGLMRRPPGNRGHFRPSMLVTLSEGDTAEEAAALKRRRELEEEMARLLSQQKKARRQSDAARRELVRKQAAVSAELADIPVPAQVAMGAAEGRAANCKVNVAGDPHTFGAEVPRGFVQVLRPASWAAPEIGKRESGRLQLAEWLASRDNPLTARVMANRVWYQLFGRGIVGTVDNFGKMGEAPSNQKLLDYLAVRFIDEGWSVKKLVREVVLSRAYQLSSAHQEKAFQADPENRLVWRMNRKRLEVEAIRDALLAIGGTLDRTAPEGSPAEKLQRSGEVGRGRNRAPDYTASDRHRTVYLPIFRSQLPAMLEMFDFPEPSETHGARDVTTVPTQALFLMNSPLVIEQSKKAAQRAMESAGTDRERAARAYREVLGRNATAKELSDAADYVATQRGAEAGDSAQLEAWARFYQALFASAEFRYRI